MNKRERLKQRRIRIRTIVLLTAIIVLLAILCAAFAVIKNREKYIVESVGEVVHRDKKEIIVKLSDSQRIRIYTDNRMNYNARISHVCRRSNNDKNAITCALVGDKVRLLYNTIPIEMNNQTYRIYCFEIMEDYNDE